MGEIVDLNPTLKTSFSYEALEGELAERLYQQAERIRRRIAGTAQDMIDIGLDLAAAKAGTEHGTFTSWVEAECGITPRLAQMYMRAAEWVADKSEIISLLQPTAILKLSAKSTPDDVRADVINRVMAGERVQVSQIDNMLYNAREEKKERERLERMSPKIRKKREADKVALAKCNEQWRLKEQEKAARQQMLANELANILTEHVPPDHLDRLLEIMHETELFNTRYESGVRTPSKAVCALQAVVEECRSHAKFLYDAVGDENKERMVRILMDRPSEVADIMERLPDDADGDETPSQTLAEIMYPEHELTATKAA
jgi:hypothetical protein